jgi:hypothetical protein
LPSSLASAKSADGCPSLPPSLLHSSFHPHFHRVDLDVLGTKNTLVKHEIVKADVLYDWSNT